MRIFLCVVVVVASCVGDSTVTPTDGGSDVTVEAGGDAACTPSCTNATTFHGCAQADQTCALGCVSTGTPHCAVLEPSSPVVASDLTAPGVGDLVFSKLGTMHTDTGAIDGVRAANADPATYEVVSNIRFRLFSGA